jgi:hypothetical protein
MPLTCTKKVVAGQSVDRLRLLCSSLVMLELCTRSAVA